MDWEPTATGRLPVLGGIPVTIFSSIGVDLPIPQKTHPRHGAVVADVAGGLGYNDGCQGGSGGSGWSRGSAVAWGRAPSMADPRLEFLGTAAHHLGNARAKRRV